MKKIITMVGTSMFENYLDDNPDKNFKNYYESLKDKDAKNFRDEEMRINHIKSQIEEWYEQTNDKINISAEIKSIFQLKRELDEELEVYLLCSDTILSKLAGEILKEKIKEMNLAQEVYIDLIEDLQVKDRKRFFSGMTNLINRIYKIANEYWDNVIINITGGFKATLPYLTIIAQVNKCPIYYIFEETDALIKVPYLPIDINWGVFEENKKFLMELEREKIKQIPNDASFKEEIESLVEKVDGLIAFNPLGFALWQKYKERYDLFYISVVVYEKLNKEYDSNQKNIAKKSFKELLRRLKENPTHPDLNHHLSGIDLDKFKCFKHKEDNIQVRILYMPKERITRYGSTEIYIYIGDIVMGREVHNVESEYVKEFEGIKDKISDIDKYSSYKITKKEV